ncbi:MAG: hypothetical protein D4R73_05505 [Deltaproteobacteria bacterium]|nr:MAG: hypothetical protein D4R73_05505 [Deltaproteobacteria bacterium]
MLRARGFSLIELITILVLVGILAFAFYHKLTPLYGMRLGAASKKIASDIHYAQQLALATQVASGVSLSTTQYTVYRDINSLQKAKDPLTGKDLVVNLDQGDYGGVTITGWTFAGNGLKFDSTGKPYDLNGTALTADGSLTVTGGGSSKTVVVKPDTGKVFVQ